MIIFYNKDKNLIKLENITKIYPNGFNALKDVSLNVAKGEICGIIGYSGAGKSTLLRCINLLERPSSGSVSINGTDMLSLSEKELAFKRQKIGMIFQHFNLLSARDVAGNVAYALEIAGWQKEKIAPRVSELLELVGLKSRANFRISQLSGGQKQRVAIARALANSPEILLCDEATSALDPKTTRSILSLLKELKSSLNLTVVLITHQIEVIKEIADKVYVISGGQIVESGDVFSIFSSPQMSVTRELVGQESIEYGKDCYRIVFDSSTAKTAIISNIIKKCGVDINILSGNIDSLANTQVGHLNVKLLGSQQQISSAISELGLLGAKVLKLSQAPKRTEV